VKTATRIGWGIVLVIAALVILLHPAFYPLPTVVASQFHMPLLLEMAVIAILALYRHKYFLTQFFSRCFGDHQQLLSSGPDVSDLICTRLC
jgi:hypothetical protein